MEPFSATACLKFGWEVFKKRAWFLIGVAIAYTIILGAVGSILGKIGGVNSGLNVVTTILNWVFQVLMGMGFAHFSLKAHDDVEHVTFGDLWYPKPFLYYLGAMILYLVAIVGGVILLVVPGIIFAIMFCFYQYIIVEQNIGPIEALKESKRITSGYKWELFILFILSVLVLVLGALCLLVGVFVAMPVVSLAFVHAYRMLRGHVMPTPAL